jgi:hypothetical protein
MAQSSGNVSNIVSFGGVDSSSNLTIPEANSQGYFSLTNGGGVASGNFGPFYKNGVLYQVTSGKTCMVVSVTLICPAANSGFQFVSSGTTYATNAGSITSGTYQGGAAANYGMYAVTAYVPAHYAIPYSFVSLSYPGLQTNGNSGQAYLICKEV